MNPNEAAKRIEESEGEGPDLRIERRYMYEFESARDGRCQVEAKTSGKYGFGLPKHFVFLIQNCDVSEKFIVWYRNSEVGSTISSKNWRDVDLLRIAIAQFCSLGPDESCSSVELDVDFAAFVGDITNRHGRVISDTSVLPRRE